MHIFVMLQVSAVPVNLAPPVGGHFLKNGVFISSSFVRFHIFHVAWIIWPVNNVLEMTSDVLTVTFHLYSLSQHFPFRAENAKPSADPVSLDVSAALW